MEANAESCDTRMPHADMNSGIMREKINEAASNMISSESTAEIISAFFPSIFPLSSFLMGAAGIEIMNAMAMPPSRG